MTLDEYAPSVDSADLLLEALAENNRLSGTRIEGGFSWPEQNIDAVFSGCRFDDGIFAGGDLAGASFEDCEFAQCSLRGADLRDTRFSDCKLYLDDQASDFRYCELRDARFENCDLTTCTFERANAYGLKLIRCQAQGADFTNVDFGLTMGRKQTLTDFECDSCNLAYANFSSTHLEGAVFKSSRLAHAVLHNCDLRNARLTDCELDNLDAARLTLTGANLCGSRFNNLNPKEIDLTGAQVDADQALSLLSALGIDVV